MEQLTIGQMAQMNHVSEQALRLYDKIGLLSPVGRGSENSYRYYDIRQSARLDMIQYMKSLGMGLKDIKANLDGGDIPELCRLLTQREENIEAQIKQLRIQQLAVHRTIKSFERYESAPPDGAVLLKRIDRRMVYCVDSKINFYDYGIEVYEKILRELKGSLIADQLPQLYFCNVGTIMRRENLLRRRFVSTEVFVFVDREFVREELVTVIPGGSYLCIYCDRFDKEREYAEKLLDSAARQGMEIAGDYICEVVAELPVIGKTERGMFLRLQVPVRFNQ